VLFDRIERPVRLGDRAANDRRDLGSEKLDHAGNFYKR
jgi:hypothetical protein